MNNQRPVALITGASRGIGEAIAETLASNNYDLIITCGNSMTKLTEVSNRLIQKYNINCTPIRLNAEDFDKTRQLFDSISQLDVLINNAGISHIGLLQDMTIDEWHHIINTNLSSIFYTSKCAIPLMLKNHSGKIINISSVWGCYGASMEVAYSASKGGINAFTKALAKELAPSHIAVNAIACGAVDTTMNSCFSESELEELADEIPYGRMASAKEIAEAVYSMLTAPAYMTGQIITIDGGWN